MQAGRDDLARYPEISKLLPLGLPPTWVRDFDKRAGARCQHQRHTGCSVYDRRPFGCRIWSCAWLSGADTAEMRRPDRAGYVVDMVPDFIRYVSKDGSGPEGGTPVEVVQIWIDPKRRDDWRQDAELRAFIERRAAEGKAAILRFSEREALILIAPALSEDKQWHEISDAELKPERSTWPDDVRIAMEITP
jgi:Fe-S-cluster containining protein